MQWKNKELSRHRENNRIISKHCYMLKLLSLCFKDVRLDKKKVVTRTEGS